MQSTPPLPSTYRPIAGVRSGLLFEGFKMHLEPKRDRPHDVYTIPVPETGAPAAPRTQPLGLLLRRTFEKVVAVMKDTLRVSGLVLNKVRPPTWAR